MAIEQAGGSDKAQRRRFTRRKRGWDVAGGGIHEQLQKRTYVTS
jgi:hypothetical protein